MFWFDSQDRSFSGILKFVLFSFSVNLRMEISLTLATRVIFGLNFGDSCLMEA